MSGWQDTPKAPRSLFATVEWPTLSLLIATYVAWMSLVFAHGHWPSWLIAMLLAPLVTLHSSLQHEIIHGHPTGSQWLNTLLGLPALGWLVPLGRFEVLHMRHHRNHLLTDPFDDTETQFKSLAEWRDSPTWKRLLLTTNNTLIGRMLLGPPIMAYRFLSSEAQLLLSNRDDARRDWLLHLPALVGVLAILWLAGFPLWLYLLAVVWPAYSLLMIRIFSEHLPSENVDERSAIVNSGPIFSLLFLNNNLHQVHHEHPEVPWYYLPALRREHYADIDGDHVIDGGYRHLFRRYAFHAAQPVAHPFLRRR